MNLEKHLLNHVFQVGAGAQHAIGDRRDRVAVLDEELRERRRVATLGALDDLVQLTLGHRVA